MEPVLFDIYDKIYGNNYRQELPRTYIVAHVHCLPSFYNTIIKSLIGLGVPPSSIIIVPKYYSSIPFVVKSIRKHGVRVIESDISGRTFDEAANLSLIAGLKIACVEASPGSRLLLLDDGGILTDLWSRHFKHMGLNVVSIQQTTSGVYRRDLPSWGITYVDVARSAAKRIFESSIIASGILRKLDTIRPFGQADSIGIVGVGAVGTRLATELVARGKRTITYDRNPVEVLGAERVTNGYELFDRSEGILGCTGKNWMSALKIDEVLSKNHWLASCSSRNIEFKALIDGRSEVRPADPFARKQISGVGHAPQIVWNGGFPINFDRRREWENEKEIFLTRALVFAGIVQAATVETVDHLTRRAVLNPEAQQEIVRRWLSLTAMNVGDFAVDRREFEALGWWLHRSGSEFSQ